MSVFRDQSILKGMLPNKTIEQSAELHLFLLVEQNVKRVIQEAMKYQRHFRRKSLTSQDVELAIKDQNLVKFEIAGFHFMDSINLTKRMDEFALNDQNMDLKDLISHQMRTVRIPLAHPTFSFYNVMRDFQMINSQETQNIQQYKEILQNENFQNDENKKSFSIIKDNVQSILTVHQQQIIKLFRELYEKEIISLKLHFSNEFSQLLSDLENYRDVAEITPFLVAYLYSQIEGQNLFYHKSRLVIVECIYRLILNTQINIEFQLHQILKLLVLFLTEKIHKVNIKTQIQIFSKTAMCLNYVMDKFSLKYQGLRINMDKIFLDSFQKLLINFLRKKSYKKLIKAYAIIEYFLGQNISLQHIVFAEALAHLVQNITLENNIIDRNGQTYNEIAGLIQLCMGKLLNKIVNGLKYLEPNNETEILQILKNSRILMNELGLGEMHLLQQSNIEYIML